MVPVRVILEPEATRACCVSDRVNVGEKVEDQGGPVSVALEL